MYRPSRLLSASFIFRQARGGGGGAGKSSIVKTKPGLSSKKFRRTNTGFGSLNAPTTKKRPCECEDLMPSLLSPDGNFNGDVTYLDAMREYLKSILLFENVLL